MNKTITGSAAGDQGAVTIQVACNGMRLPDFTIPARAPAGTISHTYSGLPRDATCTLSETQNGHTNTVKVSVTGAHQVTIPGNGAATADFVDTYTSVPGKLRVEKTIAGPGAGRQGAVRIQVRCDGQRLPVWVIREGMRAGSRAHTYTNLPAGSMCTVSEIADGHSSRVAVTVTGAGQRVRIRANATAIVELTDTYRKVASPPRVTG